MNGGDFPWARECRRSRFWGWGGMITDVVWDSWVWDTCRQERWPGGNWPHRSGGQKRDLVCRYGAGSGHHGEGNRGHGRGEDHQGGEEDPRTGRRYLWHIIIEVAFDFKVYWRTTKYQYDECTDRYKLYRIYTQFVLCNNNDELALEGGSNSTPEHVSN